MTQGNFLIFERQGHIAKLTINNPPLNIFGEGFYRELLQFEELISDENDIRALIINASGKYFSAGIDLNYLKAANSEFVLQNISWLQKIYNFWEEQSYPVIAAVQGLCPGSGMELILGCDLRIAAEGTRFSLPEVRFGLSPDMGGTSRLARLVGIGQAKRLIMACEEIDAAEAYRIGLIEYLVPPEKLQDAALKLAGKIAGYPPTAVRFAKKGIQVSDIGGVHSALLFEQAQSTYCCGTEYQKEALKAFLEKREPAFN